MTLTLRIAQVAPPLEPVPPRGYGGTERIVAALVDELAGRGHEVTTFASGDSAVSGRLVPTVPRALRPDGIGGDWAPWFYTTIRTVLDRAHEFDLIHSHLEWASSMLAAASPVPVVSTFHGRLDLPWAARLLVDLPGAVAISRSQASAHPAVRWAAVIHNGLPLSGAPFHAVHGDALVFVGRIAPEKGILDAVDVARRTGRPLRVIAKRPVLPGEVAYFREVFLPALREAGSLVEDLGELSGPERDEVVAGSHALIMPGVWPEPFGLAAIEALACGTPVLTRRVGALPEIVREGIDGFFGDDVEHLAFLVDRVDGLDRAEIRASVLRRFSAARMADEYEALYGRTLGQTAPTAHPDLVAVGPGRTRVPIIATAEDLSDAAATRDEAGVAPLRQIGRRAAQAETAQGRS